MTKSQISAAGRESRYCELSSQIVTSLLVDLLHPQRVGMLRPSASVLLGYFTLVNIFIYLDRGIIPGEALREGVSQATNHTNTHTHACALQVPLRSSRISSSSGY